LTAGRFVLADWGGYLRAPLFPARLDGAAFEVLVRHDHPAAALRVGAGVTLIGPLGRGFEIPPAARRLLLVADSVHLPALLPLALRSNGTGESPAMQAAEVSTTLLLTAPTAADLYPVQLLPPTLEVHLVTADGSAGHAGSMFDLFPDLLRWADCVCVVDDPAIYPALADVVQHVRLSPGPRFAQALVVLPLACGVGACQGCAVRVADGFKLACKDGPVFDLLELR
jgi:dihydroorotate dehydrogenase electron transfer subunit